MSENKWFLTEMDEIVNLTNFARFQIDQTFDKSAFVVIAIDFHDNGRVLFKCSEKDEAKKYLQFIMKVLHG